MEMDAEKEDGLQKSCHTSSSQEAKFTNCLFAAESQDFGDSNPEQSSPSEAPVIFMISPPGTMSPVYVEEDAEFLTPPEHHSHSHLSSSEDQNPNESRAEADRTTKVRASEAGLYDEAEAKRVKTEVVEIEGGESADDTEVVEIEGDENVDDIVVMALDGRDSDCEEIEEFGDRKCEGRPVGKRRRLPPSLKGKEKEEEKDVVNSLEKKSPLRGLLDVIGVFFGDADSGSKDVDFLETAKRRGITFPKPRWWPSDKE